MRRIATAWITLLANAAVVSAAAQTVNLEELEAQLNREQAAEVARQAEVDRRARAAATEGVLVVRADADCSLLLNGVDHGRLQANATTSVKVNPGQQLIECDAGNTRRAEAIETMEHGEQKVLRPFCRRHCASSA